MIQKLKEHVEVRFGKKINYQKDCKALSSNILNKEGEYLSPATLRRIFGFLTTNSNPSRVTLDILSRYVGYKNWDAFVEKNKLSSNNRIIIEDIWARASEKSKKISNSTIDHIRRKSGIDFNQTIPRQFAENFISNFINSNFNSTAFVGPGGFGKSTLLAKWFEKNSDKKKFSNDVILFQQAISLETLANSENSFEDWLMRVLGISPENNFLENLLQNKIKAPGRFILIIDALDESTLQGAKLEKIFSTIADLSLKYSGTSWFKLILTARFYTWNRFKSFLQNDSHWLNISQNSFTPEGANIPLFTYDEIQKILDNTINSVYPERKIVEEFNLDLRETLSYPYFLQLFINVYHPETEYLLHDQLEIFREFIKKQVYQTPCSEEKIDILNKIIELTEFGVRPNDVKKSLLKDFYPIHLKLAGKYYAAYEELVSFGLVVEDEIENKYGGVSRIIKISNQNLFEILIIQNLLEKEGEITFDLFKKVEKQFAKTEVLYSLIIGLFQFAYKDRVYEPLKRFFELSEETLDGVLSKPTIAITLRRDEYMRNLLVPIYLKIPVARKYFFESFLDLNNLVGSFTLFLKEYPTETKNDLEKIHVNILNVYAGFLNMDFGRIERFIKPLINFAPSPKHDPLIAGRWFACMSMYYRLIKDVDPKPMVDLAYDYYLAIKLKGNDFTSKFENAFFPALVIINQIKLIEHFNSDNADRKKKLELTIDNQVSIYRYLCKVNRGDQLDSNDIFRIDSLLSKTNPTDSYHQRILGLVLESSFYLNNKDIAKAYDNIKNAIELSNRAGYKIIEVKLLKTLANVLNSLGEKTKSNECNKFAESLIDKTEFKYEIL